MTYHTAAGCGRLSFCLHIYCKSLCRFLCYLQRCHPPAKNILWSPLYSEPLEKKKSRRRRRTVKKKKKLPQSNFSSSCQNRERQIPDHLPADRAETNMVPTKTHHAATAKTVQCWTSRWTSYLWIQYAQKCSSCATSTAEQSPGHQPDDGWETSGFARH